jgi:short-subunit dehydrogenase
MDVVRRDDRARPAAAGTLVAMALPSPSRDSTAIVTGASSGIGVELARGLAKRGHGVVLVARRRERLEQLAAELTEAHGVRAEALACDLADADARARLPTEIAALGLTVEILVNNAGYGSGGWFIELDHDSEVRMIRVNCEAVVDLCHRYAPGMAERGRGAILNTASTVSFQPVVRQATYSASKAMARSFTEALHEELRLKGVSVTALCPGPVKTEFVDVAGMTSMAEEQPSFIWTTPEFVAESGLKGLERNKRVVIPGVANRAGAIAGDLTPHAVLLRAMNRFYPVGR